MKLECGSCGAIYPGDLNKQWGKTEETNGYGIQVRCTALVPNGLFAPNGEAAHEACGGFVGAIADDIAATRDSAKLVILTPNGQRKLEGEALQVAQLQAFAAIPVTITNSTAGRRRP